MKKRKIALRNIAMSALLVSSFIACDKDFADIDSDIINNENATHFNTIAEDFEVIAYTKPLSPVQTNNLPVNMLGVYNDPIYGNTTASIVTQVEPNLLDPDFGTGVVLDSVVLTVPYFSTLTEVDEEGVASFDLDSVYGSDPIKLSIFESNYYLRDFNPEENANLGDPQLYYADMTTGVDNINANQLEGIELNGTSPTIDLDNFVPSPLQIPLWDEEEVVTTRLAPALRLNLSPGYWYNKIILMEGQPELSNQNNFKNYLRGIYFKAEPTGSPGNLSLLNFGASAANITLYYSKDSATEDGERVNSTYVLNFTQNRVNFISNDFTINQGDVTNGDANLFLKGGQGSVAEIKLFDGEDIDEDNTTNNMFESFKNEFVETDADGRFTSSKRIINEANLVFYVDQDAVGEAHEPERVFLYDAENHTPLSDFFLDNSNTAFPIISRSNHLGRLQRENGESTGNGVKYKIRITEHINNLLLRDSTNVKLGLSVSGNVNLEASTLQFDVLTGDDTEEKVPVSSIVTPRGTVLYGNNTSNEEKKLYLEIIYTEPNN
ncbi:MAG: DUF4270 domain-containing protein [Algicola sp.]|nr:DUF4270 domain-containing protein [Algicola sp.]